jgi:ribosomal protein L11 methyltransferase
MTKRSLWKTLEIPCLPGEAAALWEEWRAKGATGAVTSRGSGISHREFLRVFWSLPEAQEFCPDGAELLEEEDWTPHWVENFREFKGTGGITIIPAWEERTPREEETVIHIDPGMAFGAGDHPTTRLCLKIIEIILDNGGFAGEVLDVGSGTGVLSIAAAKLGAGRVTAVDIDPFCFASAKRNIEANRAGNKIIPALISLDLLPGSFDFVMANIVAGQLQAIAEEIKDHLAPGGSLLLSGFETAALPVIEKAFAPLEKSIILEEEGWLAVLFRWSA